MSAILTSIRNPTIRHIRKLLRAGSYRREHGQFVIEGVRLAEEVLAAGVVPETVLYTEGLDGRAGEVLAGFSGQGALLTRVAPEIMQAVSDTKTPQGLLAVLPLPSDALRQAESFLLVLDGLRDPGNLGTILRTAAAGGVDAVLLTPGSADPFQPKAVRAGMGAHFKLSVREPDWQEIQERLSGKQVFLADSAGEVEYTAADFTEPLALVIGGEAHGAGKEIAAFDPMQLMIPMPGGMESLNAAVSAGIMIYEVLRQRRAAVK